MLAQTAFGSYQPVDTSLPNPNDEEFDNLYLDMNGIIHPASHPEDRPPPKTEDDMYLAIFEYLERVFAAVRPRKLLYMAIDGVAPRAKMNQQRSRRFKTAKELEIKEQVRLDVLAEWQAQGREMPPDKGPEFDHNVITPGTPFMDRLAEYLRCFVQAKICEDPGWRDIKVVFSDANVPGEGEHKIMEYIRLQRTLPDYDPNTKHVIHGLDADLIMLALALHEPHFCILREEVFPKKKSADDPKSMEDQVRSALKAESAEDAFLSASANGTLPAAFAKSFQFMRVNVLREYLEREMQQADYSVAGGFDLERVIDDFVFMCFFVGNDFLPHLPSLDIREGALDTILDLYRKDFLNLGGYLTQNGEVNFSRVQRLLQGLSSVEDVILTKRLRNEKQFAQKKVDIANKATTQEHLKLIRQCTAGLADAGQTQAKRSKRYVTDDTGIEGSIALEDVTAEHFRIKDRGVGGIRVLQPSTSQRDASKLHLYDKIREFADDVRPSRASYLDLKNLDGFQRRISHSYCEELGLGHASKGTDPNRYIRVTRPVEEGQEEEDVQVADVFKEAVKGRFRDVSDKRVGDQKDNVLLGETGWHERYYLEKFGADVNKQDIVESYVQGLAWVLRYYYQGCCSWNWFYPYHYAPFARDFHQIDRLSVKFEKGRPFSPFEQLMAVLPPRSSHALPPAYQRLMLDPESPILEFYPAEFGLDLNGARHAWQAVVLLPFINEAKLMEAIKSCADTLTPEERRRNATSNDRLFVHQRHPAAVQIMSLDDEPEADGAGKPADVAADAPAAPADVTPAPEPTPAVDVTALQAEYASTSSKLNELAAAQLQAELMDDAAASTQLAADIAPLRTRHAELETLLQRHMPEKANGNSNLVALGTRGAHAASRGGGMDPLLSADGFDRSRIEAKLAELPPGTQWLDWKASGRLFGFVAKDDDAPMLGQKCDPPTFLGQEESHPFRLHAFVNHTVRCLYFVPPFKAHVPHLLRNCVQPKKKLESHDRQETPRFTEVRPTVNTQAAGRFVRHHSRPMDRHGGQRNDGHVSFHASEMHQYNQSKRRHDSRQHHQHQHQQYQGSNSSYAPSAPTWQQPMHPQPHTGQYDSRGLLPPPQYQQQQQQQHGRGRGQHQGQQHRGRGRHYHYDQYSGRGRGGYY